MKQQNTTVVPFEVTPEQIEIAKNSLIQETIKSFDGLQEIIDTYSNVELNDIKELSAYKFVVEGEKLVKKLKTQVEKKRKELTAPALEFQRNLMELKNEIDANLDPVLKHLSTQRISFEDKLKAEEERLFAERCELLSNNGYNVFGSTYICGAISIPMGNLNTLSDEEFNYYVELGKKEVARKKAEEDRIKAEKEALQKERQEMAAEKEALKKEREELQKELAELKAQKTALDKTYNKVEEIKEPKLDEKPKENEKPKTQETPKETKPEIIQPNLKKPTTENPLGESKFEANTLTVAGFNLFRNRLISLLSGDEPITRGNLLEWAKNQKI